MKILVGICGCVGAIGIHSYLIRLAAEPGFEVRAIMTATAARIVNSAAIGAVLGSPVLVDLWDSATAPLKALGGCDVLLIAPASASTIALCATGNAMNSVSACYLASRAATIFAPSMAPEMLGHPATRRNLETLIDDGAIVLKTGLGFQVATGRTIDGALCDYREIRDAIGTIERAAKR